MIKNNENKKNKNKNKDKNKNKNNAKDNVKTLNVSQDHEVQVVNKEKDSLSTKETIEIERDILEKRTEKIRNKRRDKEMEEEIAEGRGKEREKIITILIMEQKEKDEIKTRKLIRRFKYLYVKNLLNKLN